MAFIFGSNRGNKLRGTSLDDFILGFGGNDCLVGRNGADAIFGHSGRDKAHGQGGDDTIHGGSGGDRANGDSGNDRVYGDAGHDWVFGGSGDDRVYGGAGHDRVFGDSGNDKVYGNAGGDNAHGGSGADWVFGGSGNDNVYGGGGDDHLFGNSGNDFLIGGRGDDVLNGGSGFDTARFAGSILDYDIDIAKKTTVKDIAPGTNGNDGTDVLKSVEKLVFNDHTLFLDGRNNDPIAQDDHFATDEPDALLITEAALLANDLEFDMDGLSVVSVDTTDTLGDVTQNLDGSFTYDGSVAFAALGDGEMATDSFKYTVDDGRGGTSTATVNVTITGTDNQAPVASLDASTSFADFLVNGESMAKSSSTLPARSIPTAPLPSTSSISATALR